ncbi:ras guanine nucleotide exchange factor i-related [Anaeramoeba flamelloides]|uniref:Ras guanine nucleotide exchange factor i-related n=1 Tax=Anaeramoeba flamelloides TaxID=1746091 RepID=A0AAV7Z5P8_9EUKA|nr:ras guanine nucleotide exchange factor i-related [Anaeramoeba flamelloides]
MSKSENNKNGTSSAEQFLAQIGLEPFPKFQMEAHRLIMKHVKVPQLSQSVNKPKIQKEEEHTFLFPKESIINDSIEFATFVESDEEFETQNDLRIQEQLHEEEKISVLRSKKEIKGREEWFVKIMEKHPDFKDIRERIDPISRTETFLNIYGGGKKEVCESINDELVYQLIMQYFMSLGYKKSKKMLEKQCGTKYQPQYLFDARIQTLIRVALRDTNVIWDTHHSELENEINGGGIDLINHLRSINVLDDDEDDDDDLSSIWDDDKGDIVFVDNSNEKNISTKKVKAGSLNKLVEWLTHENFQNLTFLKTFLMTYQSFTSPKTLLTKLFQRYHVPKRNELNEDDFIKKKKCIQIRVCNVIKLWVLSNWKDFSSSMQKELNNFLNKTLKQDKHQVIAQTLQKAIDRQKAQVSEKYRTSQKVAPPEPKVPKNIFSPNLSVFDVDEEEIARQITLIEFDIFKTIRPKELLNLAWSKPKLKHRAPNVIRFIEKFNSNSRWAQQTILQYDKFRQRGKVISWLIKIAEQLRKLNNFDAVMSINSGLNSSAIHRLKYSFEEVPRRLLDMYQEFKDDLSSNQSYKKYRSILHRINPPCIPYLGVYLTDLTFIEDGNPDKINGLINFSKRRLIFDVIFEIQNFQQRGYNLQPVQQIHSLLEINSVYDTKKIFAQSLKYEPRGAKRVDIK